MKLKLKTLHPKAQSEILAARGIQRSKTDLAPKVMRFVKYVPRIKHPDEAPAPSINIWAAGSYDGAELRPFIGRAGSMDAYALPSHGVRT